MRPHRLALTLPATLLAAVPAGGAVAARPHARSSVQLGDSQYGRLIVDRAGHGLRRSLLSTTRRRDGSRQVTYAGHPLYYYVADRRAGQVLCQNVREFGGDWLVVHPDGTPNRSKR